MFKGLSIFFETYSITSEGDKNSCLHPVDVSCGVELSAMKIKDLLAASGYGSITEDKNFKEIFAKNDRFEVTVSFISLPNSGTRIGLAVFSPKGKRTKKVLIGLMQEVARTFENEKI